MSSDLFTDPIVVNVGENIISVSSSGGSTYIPLNITESGTLTAGAIHYIDSLSLLQLQLPDAEEYSRIAVVAIGSGLFRITQASADRIRIGNKQTTLGVTGSVTAMNTGDRIEFQLKNSVWHCTNLIGYVNVV
ncbi:hypothetical protein [Chroococcidiopsis sp.]|uniref:hypothetical protein n=1 Tax=Chroococcidiopsis sp. TaxID=3088168 RepID=UPI003F2CB8C2